MRQPYSRVRRAPTRRPAIMLACALTASLLAALAPTAVGDTTATSSARLRGAAADIVQGATGALTSAKPAAATLTQCATAAAPQTERAATFAGEMTTLTGTARMQLRIQLQERAGAALRYRTVSAPGLGAWHDSSPGVKVFAHIQEVTDLSAPAFYRGLVSFRWLDAAGHVLRQEQLHTASCEQPAASLTPSETKTTSG